MNKTKSALAMLFLALPVGFTGCVSTIPVVVTPKQQIVANAVEDAISIGLIPVLSKNPAYVGVAQGIAGALGSFSGSTITPEDVNEFLGKTGLPKEDAKVIAGIVNAAWATYVKRYQSEATAGLRPDVKLFLNAVSNGIAAAIAALPKE